MTNELLEQIAAASHDGWVQGKLNAGITTRLNESGEEQMVPYSQLSEAVKDIDRAAVKSMLIAVDAAGYMIVRKPQL